MLRYLDVLKPEQVAILPIVFRLALKKKIKFVLKKLRKNDKGLYPNLRLKLSVCPLIRTFSPAQICGVCPNPESW